MNLIHQDRLDELPLNDWRDDFENWFIRKYWRPLGNGKDVARKAERFKRVEKIAGKAKRSVQVPEGLLAEAECFETMQRVIQTAGNEIIPILGKATREKCEDGCLVHSF